VELPYAAPSIKVMLKAESPLVRQRGEGSMNKLFSVTALCLLCVGVTSVANANTIEIFDAVGSFANIGVTKAPFPIPVFGTLTVDVTEGSLTGADFFVPFFPDFTKINTLAYETFHYTLVLENSADETLFIDFTTSPSSNSLIGLTDGTIIAGTVYQGVSNFPVFSSLGGSIFIVANPIPAALPLFASGLGAMGLFGWRRKRKNVPAIGAA
jgi:hypothetical protein